MSHSHGHSHAGHSHGASADADRGKLAIALALILAFMAAEVVTGIIANSLALLSDAAHMLTDAAAIGFSLVAINLAQRPAEGQMTFGLKRAEILSAQANGITLLVLAAIIAIEAVRRLISPPEVEATLILVVALAGIVVNLAATATLAKANRESLNVEGSFQHILTDLFAFVGTAIAATVILLTGFDQADAIASLLVAGLMLRSAIGLSAIPAASSSRRRRRRWTRRRSAAAWPSSPAWSRSTTCTSGRSPPSSPLSPPTSPSTPTPTATAPGSSWRS